MILFVQHLKEGLLKEIKHFSVTPPICDRGISGFEYQEACRRFKTHMNNKL